MLFFVSGESQQVKKFLYRKTSLLRIGSENHRLQFFLLSCLQRAKVLPKSSVLVGAAENDLRILQRSELLCPDAY